MSRLRISGLISLFFLLAVGASSAPIAPRIAVETGKVCRHFYRIHMDGSTMVQERPESECLALAVKGAGQPTMGGATWLKSELVTVWDTPDGLLQEGDAEVTADGIIMIVGGRPAVMDGATVVNGRVVSGRIYDDVIITGGLVERRPGR